MEDNTGFKELVETIKTITGFPCWDYKEKPLKRRLRSRMKALNINNYRDYKEYIHYHREEIELLKTALTINLTRFFRNSDTYEYIKEFIVPYLEKNFDFINIWSVGCASGEEPYSLAMLFEDTGKDLHYKILATDIDEVSIDKARKNRYNNFSMSEVSAHYLDNYFIKYGDEWGVKDLIKSKVKFDKLNLSEIYKVKETFQMIVCRNVLIYFEKEFQLEVINNLYEKLEKNGVFILGRVEMIPLVLKEKFEPLSRKHRIYRKV